MATKKWNGRTGSTKKADQEKKGGHERKEKAEKERTRLYNTSAISAGAAQPVNEEPQTFHEIIINNIVSNSKGRNNVPDEAMLLGATISSLSSGMRELRYKSGMNVGKALYKQSSLDKSYMFQEESVRSLVNFFDAAGYSNVTYRAYPDDIEIKIHERNNTDVGANIHSFEAGIISGYLSAMQKKYTAVHESTCSNNGGNCCTFTIKGSQNNGSNSVPSMERFAASISERAKGPNANRHAAHVSDAYCLLSSSRLLDQSYLEPLKEIAAHTGREISDKLFEGKRAQRSFFSYIENTIRLLNLGEPEIKSTNPLQMEVKFNGIDSRSENVDLALAFIEGLISDRFGKEFVASERTNNGKYVLDIREARN